MFCTECGKQINSSAKFCASCGAQVTLVSAPQSVTSVKPPAPPQPAASVESIWNPLAIVFWSLLFGPVWGTQLAWLNWKRIGNNEKLLKATRNWQLGAFAITYAANKATTTPGTDDMTAIWVTLAFLWGYVLLWVLASHRIQISQVRASFGASYPRRSWLWPIVIGIGLYVLLGFLQYWQA